MFGKYSISSVLFYTLLCYLIFIFIQLGKMLMPQEHSFQSYDVWASFKLNLIYIIPQLILISVLLLIFYKFKSSSIFSKKTIQYLNILTILCFLSPVFKVFFSFLFFNKNMLNGYYNLLPYVIFGIFSLFLSSIFTNGFKIQQENDLTI